MLGDREGETVLTPTFVDRESELKKLREYLDNMIEGRGRVVFIAGEAGIGKTKLIEELGKSAVPSIWFLRGQCLYYEEATPYLPFIEALRHYFESERKESRELEREILPMGLIGLDKRSVGETKPEEIEETLPLGLIPIRERERGEAPAAGLEVERDKRFEAISQAFINISKKKPLILFLDDLQWIDDTSLQLLTHIARDIIDAKILICGAYRPEELVAIEEQIHPLSSALQRMEREKLCTILRVKPLGIEDVEGMVKNLLQMDVPRNFVEKLYEETEGNPFFVEEVLRSLVEERVVNLETREWDKTIDLSKLKMPTTIKDVVSRRIEELDHNSRRVIAYASVIGLNFSFDVLEKVTDLSENALIDALDLLIDTRLIHENPPSNGESYSFQHKQIMAVIHDSLRRGRKRVMHKRVGDAIEKIYARRIDDMVYPLARHFTIGKDFEKALKYSIKAGEKAQRIYALNEAINYYNTAIKMLVRLEPDKTRKKQEIDILTTLGRLSFAQGEWDEAMSYYNQSLELSEEVKNDMKSARASIEIGYILSRRGYYDDAVQSFEKSLELSERASDAQGMADANRGLGYVHWRMGEAREAIEHYNQGIKYAMEVGDEHTIAKIFNELGNAYNSLGNHGKAIEYYTKSIAGLEKIGDMVELGRVLNNIGDIYLQKKKWEKAIEYFEKCKEVSEKIGNKNMIAWSSFNAAEAYAHKLELDIAEEYCNYALVLCREIKDKIGLSAVQRNLGLIYRLRKKWNKALKHFNKAMELVEELGIPFETGKSIFELALLYRDMGEKEKARGNLEKALALYQKIGAKRKIEEVKRVLKTL